MTFFLEFTSLALTAVFLENVIFSRALGTSRMLGVLKRRSDILAFGITVTCITLLAAALSYPMGILLQGYEVKSYFRPLAYVLCVAAVYLAVYTGTKHFLPKLFLRIGRHLTFASFNCAVLGSIFLSANQSFTFAKSLGFGFGSGLGFTLATLLVAEGSRRLLLCDVPKSFRGFPILLIYIGLVALSLYGLVGHQLPF